MVPDHGAILDFGFPGLGPGENRSFTLYYGAAKTTARADEALYKIAIPTRVRNELAALGMPLGSQYGFVDFIGNAVQILTTVNTHDDTSQICYGRIRPAGGHPRPTPDPHDGKDPHDGDDRDDDDDRHHDSDRHHDNDRHDDKDRYK